MIWRLEKGGKGTVAFTVLLMWHHLDTILWFNISLIGPAWKKPLILSNSVTCSGWWVETHLKKKNPGLIYSSWGNKKSLQYAQILSQPKTPWEYHPGILMQSLWDSSSQHAQLEEKVHTKTWAYLQSIVKYIFKYKSLLNKSSWKELPDTQPDNKSSN